mgnify:CR=1 FL=1|jgi:glycosyltransferase 2 family protein|tara:strand:- start:184 stop:1095 length:912 start_codon:yes stop_codon:yes gene_type:complete
MINIIIKSTKILIIFLIFYYLYENNHFNLDIFVKLTSSTFLTVLLSCLIFSTHILGAYRWSLVLKSSNIKNSFLENFKIFYMCTFFNNFLFGNLGGDFIKIYYVSKLNDSNKIKNSFSVIIDRIFGFLGLSILGLMSFCLILYNQNNMKYALSLPILLVIFIFIFGYLSKFLRKIKIIGNLIKYFQLNILLFLKCTFLSIIIFSIVHFTTYIISSKIFMFDIKMNHIFFSNFISLFVAAIPISPGGMGIGEMSFVFINKNFFDTYLNNLANIIIYFRLIVFMTSLPGVIFFINYKKKTKISIS